jgi:hypothetical protein
MPGPMMSTDAAAPGVAPGSASQPSQPPQGPKEPGSPTRPRMSPITPPLRPTQLPAQIQKVPPLPATPQDFSQGRQTYTHNSQTEAAALPQLPPPEPIAFDTNPDVLALKSAISILQIQKRRALGDMQALARAKEEALERPDDFAEDLSSGRVRQASGPQTGLGSGHGVSDTGDSMAVDDEDEAEDDEGGAVDLRRATSPARAWTDLPQPQNIVRCPPINWSQYAVVGESLDKLHAEQVAAPTSGVPAVIGPDGALNLKMNSQGPQPTRLVGIAAPYSPSRDKLGKRKPAQG